MPYKFCPNCFSTSYSNSDHQIWICPTCGKNIAFMPGTRGVESLVDGRSNLNRPRYLQLVKGGKL